LTNRILIVDDEPHVIYVIKQYIERRGYIVSTAENGIRGLEAYEKERPDIIITDIQMPLMSGQEFCEKILERYADNLPIIFVMTSRTDKQLRSWAEKIPTIKFLEKPLSLRRLSLKLEAATQDN